MDTPNGYAELLRSTINTNSSRRKLSFELAAKTGNKQESEYRAIGKYLAGEEPTPARAALLAVLLQEPKLALVSDTRGRNRDRLEELAKTVQQLREDFDRFVRSVSLRRAEYEADQEIPTHQADQPSSPEAK